VETEDHNAVFHISLPGLNADCCDLDVQTMTCSHGFGESGSFDSLHNWRANLVQYSASTIGAFNSWQSPEALWCDFFVATMTNVDHKISPLKTRSKAANLGASLGRIELMKLFLWWCTKPTLRLFRAAPCLLPDHYLALS